jgi:enterochelin esterase-like enzyme
MADSFVRHTTSSGTRFAVHAADGAAGVWVVLFDGASMIADGVPAALDAARSRGELPAVSTIYVESIDGAARRGPARCASLTTAAQLDRCAGELRTVLADAPVDRPAILVGHSLGAIAALHLAAGRPPLAREVVLLSAALWWPGEDGQLSGAAVIDEALTAPDLRVWMTAGADEGRELLQSNEVLAKRLAEAGRPPIRQSRPGGHEVRPVDVVSGLRALLAAR